MARSSYTFVLLPSADRTHRRSCGAIKDKAHVSNNRRCVWDELQLEAPRKWLRKPGPRPCRPHWTRTRRSVVICWCWMFTNAAGDLPEHQGENYCVNIFYLHSNNCIAVSFFFFLLINAAEVWILLKLHWLKGKKKKRISWRGAATRFDFHRSWMVSTIQSSGRKDEPAVVRNCCVSVCVQ